MPNIEIIAIIAGLLAAAAVAMHGPQAIALGIAKIFWNIAQSKGERLAAVLVAPRTASNDRWAATSKEDRQLLARSLASAMNRTQMRSLLPAQL